MYSPRRRLPLLRGWSCRKRSDVMIESDRAAPNQVAIVHLIAWQSVDLVSRGIPPRNRDSLPTTDVIFVEGDEVKTRGISAEGEAGEAQSSRMRQLATMIAPNSDSLWGDQELEVIAIR